jgi:phage gpG-like protein
VADFSLTSFAGFLTGAVVEMEHHRHEALEHAAKIIEVEAKSYPGTYQPGWPPLAEATIAQKATGDSPLLETGELRDSYQHKVVGRNDAYIGSDNDKAIWHELGTSRGIPPRPILSTAAMKKETEVVHLLGRESVKGLIKAP